MQSAPKWTAVQGAAIIILLRLFTFFCCPAPYSAPYAKAMFLAAAIQSALILPMLRFRHKLRLSPAVLWLLRIYAVFYAALLTLSFAQLYRQLQLRDLTAAMLLLALALLYTVSLHDRASARTATLLLCAAAFGFLLLPVSGIGTAQRILLRTPDSGAAAFLREWQYCGELPLLPLIWQKQSEQSARRSTLAWAAVRVIALPAIVLFGAMQNGRLMRFEGNPFFLLLARTPLSEAVRTDGFWMLLAFAAGALCITFCLQTAKPHRGAPAQEMLSALLPYAFAIALMLFLPRIADFWGIAAVGAGIVLPWAIVLYRQLRSGDAVQSTDTI